MKLPPFPHPLQMQPGKGNVMTYFLTDEQEAWMRHWYPVKENGLLMQESGMSHSTLHRFARQLGLKKSARGLHAIKRRQAKSIKKTCEANGYYDSLRGKAPSEAAHQGTLRMWQEIRDGKREHPARIMARENPAKYAEWMQHKSEARKETFRKEQRRLMYGLPRQTKLVHVVLNKYTRSQTCHRYNALNRGYILTEDCSEQGGDRYNIYYDDETERSALFERNCEADGLHILPWESPLPASPHWGGDEDEEDE